MLQIWGHGNGLNVETNCNCIPVIYRRFAEGSHALQGQFAYFISGYFGRYTADPDYVNWLDNVHIPNQIQKQIRKGSAIVVVDDTAESFSTHDIGPTLERFSTRHNLDDSNFVFSTNNLGFKKQSYCDVYSAPFALEYCKYAIIDKDPLYYDPIMQQRGRWEYPFISLGGEPREHRRILHNMIRDRYPDTGICTMNTGFRGTDYSDIQFTPESSPYEKDNTEPFIWHQINARHYINIPYAAVMETYISSDRSSITEKAFKNLVYPQPFVLLGAAGIIDRMKQYGYNFYDDILSHDYDTIQDNATRIKRVFESFSWLIEQPTNLVYERTVTEHNRNISRKLTIAQDFVSYLHRKLS
jgi:hypothetical protein